MSFEDDLHRIEEHIAEARRFVQQQKGLIARLRTRGVDTWNAQKILSLLEKNLRRFEEHRDHLAANVPR
jgi:hypothetical protein